MPGIDTNTIAQIAVLILSGVVGRIYFLLDKKASHERVDRDIGRIEERMNNDFVLLTTCDEKQKYQVCFRKNQHGFYKNGY